MFEISCRKSSRIAPGLPFQRAGVATGAAVKNIVFGNQNIFKDRKNSSRDLTPVLQSLAVYQIIFSLHVDVKERTFSVRAESIPCSPRENGGPDRTRTYDPRLIKAVL